MQGLQDRALAGAVRAEEQRDRFQIDSLRGSDSLEVFDLDPAEAHGAILQFATKGALGKRTEQ
ncbi:protein of unknown function (plasmid) [Methylocella tundrae]|uniref:Uncharacterized protein n=1 Tax=Methylocella tundrae TaxID=227605 RepID=A0A4U8Z7F6_METTU|nr:protein of unknown function [Methylocella tundrae]